MPNYVIQRGLRRGKTANRIGVALFVVLVLALIVSVIQGVTGLRA